MADNAGEKGKGLNWELLTHVKILSHFQTNGKPLKCYKLGCCGGGWGIGDKKGLFRKTHSSCRVNKLQENQCGFSSL